MTAQRVKPSPYIADFLSFELRRIIEVDGGQHADSVRDIERNNWLAQNKFRVLRFWINDVLQDLEGVLTCRAEQVDRTPHRRLASARRYPLPQGERGRRQIAR